MTNIYTIPAYSSFANILAKWVLENYASNPLELSKVLILLPNRRSVVALRDAFLRVTGGKPMLLPRMQPIGDVDDASLFSENSNLQPSDAFEYKRLFILTKLIQKYNNSRADHAIMLANKLADLFDEIEREQASLKGLANIVPEEFAKHWQLTLEFLKILEQFNPTGELISPISCRNQALLKLADNWKENPPDYPIIAAGTTGSVPSTANLLEVIAKLPKGKIILPAFENKHLQNINETHPQYGMAQLLNKLKYLPEDVKIIAGQGAKERAELISEIMRPAEIIANSQINMDKALSGIKKIVCANQQEEATAIALILREVLENKGKTAALVTHDRELAHLVANIMPRFGVNIDDSAGVSLLQTPIAVFLRLVAEVAASNLEILPLISLLKHPLTNVGMNRFEFLESTREYELAVRSKKPVANDIKQIIENIFNPFLQILHNKTSSLNEIIKAHLDCAEQLSEKLWEGEEAEALADIFSQIQLAGGDIEVADGEIYPSIFENLLAGKVYRSNYATHPRLKILSPIESRMQSFDLVIIGGLNEGSFPPEPKSDAWFNRSMLKEIGLPSPDRQIGMAAHDFLVLANSPQVYLTRSEKVAGKPTMESRWLIKLGVLLDKFDITDNYFLELAKMLDNVEEATPITRPRPTPPLVARPKKLSVTQIETLRNNPYAIYAKHILNLSALEPLVAELNGADFGNYLHKILERFVRDYPTELPANAEEILLQYGEQELQPLLQNEVAKALWLPRFAEITKFVIEEEKQRRAMLSEVLAEITASKEFAGFTLHGRADRIENCKDGGINIIDYKTGGMPSEAIQLALLAILLAQEGQVINLEYWQLKGSGKIGKTHRVMATDKIPEFIAEAKEGVLELIAKYNNSDFPYLPTPLQSRANKYDDYNHLARTKEWG